MGFETFDLVLGPGQEEAPPPRSEIEAFILNYSESMRRVPVYGDRFGYSHFVCSDPDGVIELQLHHDTCRLSIRYALCGPPCVDRKAAKMAYDVAHRFGWHLEVFNGAAADTPTFDFGCSPTDIETVLRALSEDAQQKRRMWTDMTGIVSERRMSPDECLELLIARRGTDT